MTQTLLFLPVFLTVYLLQAVSEQGLEQLNRRYSSQQADTLPASFAGFIDRSKLSQINQYTHARSLLGSARALASDLVLLVIILTGFMPVLERLLTNHQFPFTIAGLLFFFVPGFIQSGFDMPFDYYQTFVVEEKFGFNRSTLKIWLMDHLKSGLLSLALSSILLSLIFWTIRYSPDHWWVWGFCIVSVVQITLAILYPVLIAPLFNKFVPLENKPLAEKIKRLMEENGITVKNILQMDAATRSKHTNAYFTGLGKTKQIVLYDTLLQTHPDEEILAVLAHEAGHFKKRHILKQLLFFEVAALAAFFLSYKILNWPALYSAFGFETPKSYIGLFFVAIFWQKAGFFLLPLYMSLSRHFERQADFFAAAMLKDPMPLATALKRMAADNLSNLSPHPLYVRFNYSHPPLVARVSDLENKRLKTAPSSFVQGSES